MYNCYLTCPRGLEEIAGIDIQAYAHTIEPDKGGIKFQTDQQGIYKINVKKTIQSIMWALQKISAAIKSMVQIFQPS